MATVIMQYESGMARLIHLAYSYLRFGINMATPFKIDVYLSAALPPIKSIVKSENGIQHKLLAVHANLPS